eukprot:evm.model.scf_636EXC.1 EVM.evm.TU.scf_636EXC.1   scf_636EXC:1628-5130(-)
MGCMWMAAVLLLAAVAMELAPPMANGVPDKGPFDALAGGPPLGSVDTSCLAFSFLEVEPTAGNCTPTASAQCEEVRSMSAALREVFDPWLRTSSDDSAPQRLCDPQRMQAASAAIRSQAAKVWASAFVKIQCEGETDLGCGWTLPATALDFGMAMSEAVAIAADRVGAFSAVGWCAADVRAMGSRLLEAAEGAREEVCGLGDGREEFESLFFNLSEIGVAESLNAAVSAACPDLDLPQSSCLVNNSNSGPGEEGFAQGAFEAPWCERAKENCCGKDFKNKRVCQCQECNGPLQLHTAEKETTQPGVGAVRKWQDTNGDICTCPPPQTG